MDFGLKDKVAVVTGGSRGLGRAMAFDFVREGAKVAISARDAETLQATADQLRSEGGDVLSVQGDMTKEADIERLIAETLQRFGRIDVLVNNVGGSRGGSAPTDEDWYYTVDLNLMATVRACRLAVPEMRKQGWGRIINISSIYGRESGGGPTYNAAKSAIIAYSKSLALQLAPEGITVNTVCPGSIQEPGNGWDRRVQSDPESMKEFVRLNIPAGRFGSAPELAHMVTFLASEQASWVTGTAINVDGGQSRSNI